MPALPTFDQTRLSIYFLDPSKPGYAIPQYQRLAVTNAAKAHYTTASTNYGFLLTNWSDHGHDGSTFATSEVANVNERPMMLVYSSGSIEVNSAFKTGKIHASQTAKLSKISLDGRLEKGSSNIQGKVVVGRSGFAGSFRTIVSIPQ